MRLGFTLWSRGESWPFNLLKNLRFVHSIKDTKPRPNLSHIRHIYCTSASSVSPPTSTVDDLPETNDPPMIFYEPEGDLRGYIARAPSLYDYRSGPLAVVHVPAAQTSSFTSPH